MTDPCCTDGLTHLGLLYDSAEDLVETALPHLRNALQVGYAVSTLVDPRVAHGLAEALGDSAGDVGFESPNALIGPHPQGFLRRLREIAAPARRALVLAQYSAFTLPTGDVALGEDGINLVLRDLPLTMMCACERTSGLASTVRDHHPHLVRGRVTEGNPDYRVPDDRCPTRSTTWGGAHALRMLFRDTGDLARIRAHMTSLTADSGIDGDSALATTFAVHEAAVLACDGVERAQHPDPCVLDVWTTAGHLVVEVRGPRPGLGHIVDDGAPRLPRNPLRIPDPMRYVRMFCPGVTTLGTAEERTIRIEA